MAMLIAAIWFLRAEPAWASVIRAAREQVWIHNQIERDGVPMGETWVSPELDVVAARFSTAVLFFDYRHSRFARYDSRDGVVFVANEPDSRAKRELSSVSQLTEVFRRSTGALSLFPDQIIEHWRLHSALVDGIPCDEYEIVTQPPDGPSATILLTIDKGRSLPLTLTRVDGESHTMSSRFDYPLVGPLDERSALLGIPVDAPTTDTDKTREVQGIADALEQGRRDFDDYTAFSVTARFDVPLFQCDVMRTLKRGNLWRMDRVTLSDRKFVLPMDHDQGLKALRANRNLLQVTPEVICDGKAIHCYKWLGEISANGRPVQSFKLTDDSQTDSLSPALCFPERAARPIFYLGPFGRHYDSTTERDKPFAGLIKIDSSQTPTARNPSPPPSDLYWLDPKMGNIAVRTVLHLVAPKTNRPKPAPSSPPVDFQITFSDFKQSPRGYWYPRVVNRGDITRFYVDFTDVPSDEMFRKDNPAP
ncbi:MAG TPA: hypothetical protein VGP63_09595 [Planctomycetaceae bacterium]|nr:hypothetical protein [Planctomycetaceae bacterium]